MADSGKDTLKKVAGTEKLDIQLKIQQNQITYGHFVVPDFVPPAPLEGAVKYVTPPASPRPEKDKSKKDKDKTDKDKDKSKKDKPPKPEKDKSEKDKDKDKTAKPEKDKTEKDKDKAAKPEKEKPVEKERSEKWSIMRKATMVKVAVVPQEEVPIFVPVNIVEARPPPRPTRPPTAPPIATIPRQPTNADETQTDAPKDDNALPILPGLPAGHPLIPDGTQADLPILPDLPPGEPVIPGGFNETMYAHLSAYSRQRHGSARNLDAPGSPRSPRIEKPQPIQESDSTTESHESTSESKPVDSSQIPDKQGLAGLGEALAWIDSYGDPQPEIIPYLDREARDTKGSDSATPENFEDLKGLNPNKKAESRRSGKRGDDRKARRSREDKKDGDKKPKKKTETEPQIPITLVEGGGAGTKRNRKEKSRAVVLDKTVLEEVLPAESK